MAAKNFSQAPSRGKINFKIEIFMNQIEINIEINIEIDSSIVQFKQFNIHGLSNSLPKSIRPFVISKFQGSCGFKVYMQDVPK